MPAKFEFLLFDGFSNMVLASALEPLRDVQLRSLGAQLSWRITTLTGAEVTSSSGLRIRPDGTFNPGQTDATLVLVAGYHMRDQISKQLTSTLRLAARNAPLIIAVDTASWLLAEAGVLDGHSATIHWQEIDAFQEAFSNVSVSTARFVRSGRYLSCGGASAVLDMLLDLIKRQFGPAAAFDAFSMFVYDPTRQNQLGRGAQKLRETGSPKLLAAIDVMAENIETPLTTFELAKRVSLAERTLCRLFLRELGMSPGKYFRMFRLQKARYLVEETQLSQEQIALRCGFSSGASLARSFRSEMGVAMRDIRTRQQ
ncbi:GlxA family transcriptional regulator [Cognatishimia sp. WU-CL00825]|uniref:GlxA family transcriptional regulator n=1 Tax=Cognatishimia sp. WU-CL00825 TaxID=3127658 RepID=UPI003107CEEE